MNEYIDISSRIDDGGFDLEEIIGVINYYHIHGRITTEERESLIDAARAKAAEALTVDPKEEILALWTAVRELQAKVSAFEGGSAKPGGDWPDYVQPTGAHDAYGIGAQVTYNGKHYRSLIDNNVWSPDTYPQGWEEVND